MILAVDCAGNICMHVGCVITDIQGLRTLAALHDTLLPKLISGEIRIIENERKLDGD